MRSLDHLRNSSIVLDVRFLDRLRPCPRVFHVSCMSSKSNMESNAEGNMASNTEYLQIAKNRLRQCSSNLAELLCL